MFKCLSLGFKCENPGSRAVFSIVYTLFNVATPLSPQAGLYREGQEVVTVF